MKGGSSSYIRDAESLPELLFIFKVAQCQMGDGLAIGLNLLGDELLFPSTSVHLKVVPIHLGFQLLLNQSNDIDSDEERVEILHDLSSSVLLDMAVSNKILICIQGFRWSRGD